MRQCRGAESRNTERGRATRHLVPRLRRADAAAARSATTTGRIAIAGLPAGVRQRRRIGRVFRAWSATSALRVVAGAWHSGIVDRRQPGSSSAESISASPQRSVGSAANCASSAVSRAMWRPELGFVVPNALTGEDLQRQPAGLIREQRQLGIVDRAGGGCGSLPAHHRYPAGNQRL